MIPIKLQPEPPDFHAKVRIPGQRYLQQHPNAKSSKLKAFWRGSMLKKLWEAYNGICAYLCIYIEYVAGTPTVDHLVPKSHDPQQAYEWDNFRLACLGINRKKGTKKVLDPVGLRPDSFRIDFLNGAIYPSPVHNQAYQNECRETIRALGLDSQDYREMRLRHFDEYINRNVTLSYLQKKSPFVYSEVIRQGL